MIFRDIFNELSLPERLTMSFQFFVNVPLLHEIDFSTIEFFYPTIICETVFIIFICPRKYMTYERMKASVECDKMFRVLFFPVTKNFGVTCLSAENQVFD